MFNISHKLRKGERSIWCDSNVDDHFSVKEHLYNKKYYVLE